MPAVETGKRKIPLEWISTIEHGYKLNKNAALELESAYEQSASELKISLVNATGIQKEVAISFAKALNGLDEKKLKKILDVYVFLRTRNAYSHPRIFMLNQ